MINQNTENTQSTAATGDPLAWAIPIVKEWFEQKFSNPTEPQIKGWPCILAGKNTLISAPTGSGKTLTAFLACLNSLVNLALNGQLQSTTEVLYISPLKALSNDIQKNLMQPLGEIEALAKTKGLNMSEIQVSVRSGDTSPSERQKMLKKPPHILVTTPESFYILLTAEKSRAMLADVKTVIVDEIHAVANSKRGSHLALSLQRLDAITHKPAIRIGLSATQKPIEAVAEFLSGSAQPLPAIVDTGYKKDLDLEIMVPEIPLGPVASNEMWDQIYDQIAALAQENRSTLIFVNTRRLSERIAHHLALRLGEDQVAAHHGSLSRKLRLSAETRLKNGSLKALVATASLELGIDIGTVDLVCQLGSPRAIAVALQRIGRAGHWLGGISKGRFFATTRDELLECAAIIYAIKQGDLDTLIIPEQPIDILAQQIIALCSTNEWPVDKLYELLKHALPYRTLSRETFNSVIDMLSEGIAGTRGRYGAYLHYDQVNGLLNARRGSRLIAITSGGAIPDNGLFTVISEPENIMVGTLDEDFAVESNRGDIILLGTTSWQIKKIESVAGRVIVENAQGAPPSVPFWRGEAPARTKELSSHVSSLRTTLGNKLSCLPNENGHTIIEVDNHPGADDAIQWLLKQCHLSPSAAKQAIDYILTGRAVLGAIPSQETVIAERFFDETGGMQLVIHAPFGARINKAWGLALRKKFCRSFNFELQAAATDNGINISLAEQHSFPLMDVFQFLNPNTLKETLTQAVIDSPLFATRWRWVATRSLALQRYKRGKKVPPNIQRVLSEDLLAAIFPEAAACQDNIGGRDREIPDHPLINETMKDVLTEALDIEGLKEVLQKIKAGSIRCLAVDTPIPSVFSHEILNANPYAFLDDAPLEERRARAVELRRALPDSVLQEVGKLDPEAIQEVQHMAWPDLRNAAELHDLLLTFIAIPTDLHLSEFQRIPAEWHTFFETLRATGRAGLANTDHKHYWLATEKKQIFMKIFPTARIEDNLKEIPQKSCERETAMISILQGYMLHCGPLRGQDLGHALDLPINDIYQALLALENSGFLLRGKFKYPDPSNDGMSSIEKIEWCERRLLARIHKSTLAKLRKEIAPVTAQHYMGWLLTWQHLSPGTQLTGEQGLLEIIRQLQGYEIPAKAWEPYIFAKRIKHYDRDLLDQLCLKGIIGWGRISLHPAIDPTESKSVKVVPTSNAPITFFLREEIEWMMPIRTGEVFSNEIQFTKLSRAAKKILEFMKQRGASFLADIVRGTKLFESETEAGLWELVAAGAITADSFDNLRSLIDPRRRLDKDRRRSPIRYTTGRWSLLQQDPFASDYENETTLEPTQSRQDIEHFCRLLLKRYGIVFRDLLVREKNIPRWRDLLLCFRRLEDRGEIRGGRFVEGFLGEQFALPYAVDSLRTFRNQPLKGDTITLSSSDPLNLVGILLPGQRKSSISKDKIILKDGLLDLIHEL